MLNSAGGESGASESWSWSLTTSSSRMESRLSINQTGTPLERHTPDLTITRRTIDVHVQVNTSREQSKYGVAPEAAEKLIEAVQLASGLNLVGLMTIGRLGSTTDAARPDFARLRKLRDRLLERGLLLPDQAGLSMGMLV